MRAASVSILSLVAGFAPAGAPVRRGGERAEVGAVVARGTVIVVTLATGRHAAHPEAEVS
jgi:hypothetical protein